MAPHNHGSVAANLLGVAFCLAFVLLFQLPDHAGLPSRVQQWFYGVAVMAIWPSLVLVPMAMGIAAAYFWRSLSFNLWEYFLWWIVTALISPFGAYFAQQASLIREFVEWTPWSSVNIA